MTEKYRLLYYLLWVAHPVLQMGIATLMFRRGLHRKFKFFFGYERIRQNNPSEPLGVGATAQVPAAGTVALHAGVVPSGDGVETQLVGPA